MAAEGARAEATCSLQLMSSEHTENELSDLHAVHCCYGIKGPALATKQAAVMLYSCCNARTGTKGTRTGVHTCVTALLLSDLLLCACLCCPPSRQPASQGLCPRGSAWPGGCRPCGQSWGWLNPPAAHMTQHDVWQTCRVKRLPSQAGKVLPYHLCALQPQAINLPEYMAPFHCHLQAPHGIAVLDSAVLRGRTSQHTHPSTR